MKELRRKMRILYFRMIKMDNGSPEYNAAKLEIKEMYKDYNRMYAESKAGKHQNGSTVNFGMVISVCAKG